MSPLLRIFCIWGMVWGGPEKVITCRSVKFPRGFIFSGTSVVPEAPVLSLLSVSLGHSCQHLWVAQFWGRKQAKIKQEDAETRQQSITLSPSYLEVMKSAAWEIVRWSCPQQFARYLEVQPGAEQQLLAQERRFLVWVWRELVHFFHLWAVECCMGHCRSGLNQVMITGNCEIWFGTKPTLALLSLHFFISHPGLDCSREPCAVVDWRCFMVHVELTLKGNQCCGLNPA